MAQEIDISFKGNMRNWCDTIAQSQIPFATALTLTTTAKRLGESSAKTARQRMNITRAWAGRFQMGKINGTLPQSAVFAANAADKNTPLAIMQARVGATGWQMEQQGAPSAVIRKPRNAKNYEFIPMRAGLERKGAMKKYLEIFNTMLATQKFTQILGKRRIIVTKQQQGLFMFSKGKAGKFEPLYLLRKQQQIKPRFDFYSAIQRNGNRLMATIFPRAMEHSIKTSKLLNGMKQKYEKPPF